jgi:pyruvate/2-oxoglutarate/acetoin dehydrogenase E1 component
MTQMKFGEAIEAALTQAMAANERIVVMGEDVHMLHAPIYARFGPERVMAAPISEAAFVGAAVGAAMTGLRPVVELMLVDFVAVAMDALLNHMAKLETFSGGRWRCPLVVRAACGGGYGDGGQHEQALWGMLASIPGLTVVVPSTPADAAGLLRAAIEHDGPVIFLEHKLLSEPWLEFMGRGGRDTVTFDVPAAGALGDVPDDLPVVPIGQAALRRVAVDADGQARAADVSIVSLGVGVHRALSAAATLADKGIECDVIDLRTVRPLDMDATAASLAKSGRLLVVDEDYEAFGLSGEVAARSLERELSFRFRRVCLKDTLPYARALEDAALPNVARIAAAAAELMS